MKEKQRVDVTRWLQRAQFWHKVLLKLTLTAGISFFSNILVAPWWQVAVQLLTTPTFMLADEIQKLNTYKTKVFLKMLSLILGCSSHTGLILIIYLML